MAAHVIMTTLSIEDREKGIDAVIFLQGMAYITETRESAGRGWDRMREWEKRTTLEWYARLKPAQAEAVSA